MGDTSPNHSDNSQHKAYDLPNRYLGPRGSAALMPSRTQKHNPMQIMQTTPPVFKTKQRKDNTLTHTDTHTHNYTHMHKDTTQGKRQEPGALAPVLHGGPEEKKPGLEAEG